MNVSFPNEFSISFHVFPFKWFSDVPQNPLRQFPLLFKSGALPVIFWKKSCGNGRNEGVARNEEYGCLGLSTALQWKSRDLEEEPIVSSLPKDSCW